MKVVRALFWFASLSVPVALGSPPVREIALSFDDAPMGDSVFFTSQARTTELIRKLRELKVPPVLIFANACKRESKAAVLKQLRKYGERGDLIGNHSCSHPRLDTVGLEVFRKDAEEGDLLLAPLFREQSRNGAAQKFFRFPYLKEGADLATRDSMREWLSKNSYRNGRVSIDNDDYLFTAKMREASKAGKKIPLDRLKAAFVRHILDAAEVYDRAAARVLGYSPKHVLLLHEMDATVLFIDELVSELRRRGWKLIPVADAYRDPMYAQNPSNLHAGNGIVAQIAREKSGETVSHSPLTELEAELNRILGLKSN